ncbi:uncharacterized protein LOC128958074, partial [Oppia nitens]|uniref:uncharacterized protein LOC128958074 n=1 Tax=Oppia nitens TaxID=1686743 RepID=UPI0023DA705C
ISPIISWFISGAIYRKICTEKISINNKAILITGCDTGFGHQLAIKCDKLGFYVFAGVLNPDQLGAQELEKVCSNRVEVIKMDVTNYDDVVNVINKIKSSGLELWSVVNNAGITISAPIQWGYDVKELTNILDVNVFGAVRVTKLSMPLLRQSKGRVINVSSLAGRTTYDGITYYSMSKHAIRSFSDGLRNEMTKFGINVINIEPVLYNTSIMDWDRMRSTFISVWDQTPEEVKTFFDKNFLEKYEKSLKTVLKSTRNNINEVIDNMIKGIVLKEPQTDYKCGDIMICSQYLQLVWSDEFNGQSLDFNEWDVDNQWISGNCNGIELINCFVNETKNIQLRDNCLAMTAIRENKVHFDKQFTSAKITTKKSWTFGRFEIRAALPSGKMLRPSICLIPVIDSNNWAIDGQIDIMTNSQKPTLGNGVHFSASPAIYRPNKYEFIAKPNESYDHFHTYAIEWTQTQIRWFFDNNNHLTFNINETLKFNHYNQLGQPFDKPFKLTISLGVGGIFFPNQQLDYNDYYEWQCSALIMDYKSDMQLYYVIN